MRSRLAEELRDEQQERVLRMTPDERLREALALGERAIADYVENHGGTRSDAIRALRRAGQAGRRYSKCLDEAGHGTAAENR